MSAAASVFAVPSNEPSAESFRARAQSIADIFDDEPEAGSAAAADREAAAAEQMPDTSWKSVDVDAWMPLAQRLLTLPFNKLADVTGENEWRLQSAEEDALKEPLRQALQKGVWDLKAAKYVNNPYISFVVAIIGVLAIKYTMIQMIPDPAANDQATPAPRPSRSGFQLFRRRDQPSRNDTSPASTAPSGVILKSVGESLFAAPQGAVNLPSFDNGFGDVTEY